MISILYIITKTVSVFITAIRVLMLFRAVIMLFPIDEDSGIAAFVVTMTEPVIYPFRILLCQFDTISEFPLDIPSILSFILLGYVQSALPAVI